MKKQFGLMKKFVSSKVGKLTTAGGMAVLALNAFAISAFAAADSTVPTDVTDSITSSMGSLKTGALIALGSVSAIAIVLFAGPYIWKYAKSILKTVAR